MMKILSCFLFTITTTLVVFPVVTESFTTTTTTSLTHVSSRTTKSTTRPPAFAITSAPLFAARKRDSNDERGSRGNKGTSEEELDDDMIMMMMKGLRSQQQRGQKSDTTTTILKRGASVLEQLRRVNHELRQELPRLKQQQLRDEASLTTLTRIHELEQMAGVIYKLALERMEASSNKGMLVKADMYRTQAEYSRQLLPQFNLGGLWVGVYNQKFQIINVTYTDDYECLVAYKVTGDRNALKGDVSFRVNLNPLNRNKNNEYDGKEQQQPQLEPVDAGERGVQQFGTRFMQRFAGQGQLLSQSLVNPEMIDGQLITVGKYFSFAWLPLGHQVFFGRPSVKWANELLRLEQEDVDRRDLDFLRRCLEETEYLQEEMEMDENKKDYNTLSGCFE